MWRTYRPIRKTDLHSSAYFYGQLTREKHSLARSLRITPLLSILLLTCIPYNALAQTLIQPGCGDLEQWAARLVPNSYVQISDKVKLNISLKDEQIVPLFGRSVLSWDNQELGIVNGWLGSCRKAALKAHKKTQGKQLYQAIRAISEARVDLTRLHQMQDYAERKVAALIGYPVIPELPALLNLAQDALHGKDVQAAVRKINIRGGIARSVIDLQKVPGYIPDTQIEALVAQLATHGEKIGIELQQVAADMEAARQSLAEVPMTAAGLETLDKLWQRPVLKQVSGDEARAFRQAIQQKRNDINRAIQVKQAREMVARRVQQQAAMPQSAQRSTATIGQQTSQTRHTEPTQPSEKIDVKGILESILNGDEVDELTIRGLHPGVNLPKAQERVTRQWGFKAIPSMSLTEKKFGSNDSIIEFKEMGDEVGQLEFSRYFKRMLFHKTIQNWLQERYGEPANIKSSAYEQLLTWKDGAQRLQAKLSNQLDVFEQSANFQSKIVFALWNEDYEDFMEKQNERCDEIRKLPRSEMSMEQAVWFGQYCPLGAGYHKQPGL